MMPEQKTPYAEILTLPHHKAANRPHMSMHDRAAQFSPFATLTDFDGVIAETGRRTDQKIELSESQMTLLNQKLNLIDDAVQDGYHPMVTVVYFVPDAKKDGGSYQEYTGKMRQLDPVERKLVFLAANERSAGKEISIDDILEIHGGLVDYGKKPQMREDREPDQGRV